MCQWAPLGVIWAFVVLPENELAYTAGILLVNSAGGINPALNFVYGASGVGKTRLAQHCLHMGRFHEKRIPVMIRQAAEFVDLFTEAAEVGKIPQFQQEFEPVEFLVIEDIQAFEGRVESQQQLQAQLDRIIGLGGKVLLTSRKSPGELTGFSPKLTNRFLGGVCTAIKMPAVSSRRRLLTHFAGVEQIPISCEAVAMLAEKLPVSPRELRATLVQLEAAALQEHRRIDEALIKKFLQRETLQPSLNLTEITQAVARDFELSMTQLRSRSRNQELASARQCAMYLARNLTKQPLEAIGRFFGGRDHATVVYACKRVKTLIPEQPDLRRRLARIRQTLNAGDDENC